MQNALTIEGAADKAAATPGRRGRRSPAAYARENREGIVCVAIALAVVAALYGSAFAALAAWNHNGRVQAVERAKMMDGEVYTIVGTSSNLVGDTRLFLKNARSEDCGWVMIYMSNPLNDEVNPLFTLFNRKRTRYPMKVRARYREQPHALADGKTVERFTGTFLDFERVE